MLRYIGYLLSGVALFQVFINTEMYARVSVAVLFYKLANLANRRVELENQDTLASLQCGKAFLTELLDSVVWSINTEVLGTGLYCRSFFRFNKLNGSLIFMDMDLTSYVLFAILGNRIASLLAGLVITVRRIIFYKCCIFLFCTLHMQKKAPLLIHRFPVMVFIFGINWYMYGGSF